MNLDGGIDDLFQRAGDGYLGQGGFQAGVVAGGVQGNSLVDQRPGGADGQESLESQTLDESKVGEVPGRRWGGGRARSRRRVKARWAGALPYGIGVAFRGL
ncbi:hypothetical protein Ssi02_72820 [Sinosporangium siamense]|uniref:Uncharacterized protein n=1 Tax=Sinosporangium siamense TaxID=1367973 RepID=A0A919VB06_9ACTN|nr:hypothetical protein [Sinosporangium siamense]GII97051.1 hypothetical protein Ssi02_72820 [Sinosporangium siamense]